MAFLYKDANIKKDNGKAPDILLQFLSVHAYTEGGKDHGKFNYDLEVSSV